ncbi:MAG TPA: saccharopine dehydrogenase NADP-binding domain-containing protein, partial [Bacteroidia bacterium]|nr:saccharopine dehydrogenase NADP-binding domain-containing protein [Bacteroidia bacterium]
MARTLAKSDAISRLIVADKFPEAAAKAAAKAGPKATASEVDVTDRKSLDAILEQADIVFNGVGPFYKFFRGVVEAAIDHKVNYVDINDDYDA